MNRRIAYGVGATALVLVVIAGVYLWRHRAANVASSTIIATSTPPTPEESVAFAHTITKADPRSAQTLAFAALTEASNAPEFPTSTRQSLLAEARINANRAVALAPRDVTVYQNRGDVALIAGDTAAAIVDYKKVLSLQATNTVAMFALSRVYTALGRTDDAAKLFKQAFDLASSTAHAKKTPKK